MLSLNFTPFPVLKTERLCLRRIHDGDAAHFFELRTNELAMKYIDRPRPASITEMKAYIQRIDNDIMGNRCIIWGITTIENDILIGTIGYHKIYPENYRAEVGYMLSPLYWKSGFMSECLNTVLPFGFNQLHFHSIEADINPANDASRQLLKKHGFKQEAYFRENYYFNGLFLDSEIYSLLNK
ncbi:MAG: GNAT family N-acetyltransferase [Chitinophagaceae bacterium]|nr:GNAT family N-acetyltransferase [Chitinophagaceae bacterium]